MVKFVGPVSSYTGQYIRNYANYLAGIEKMYGREIKIAERGNQILVNSGAKTSVLNMKAINSNKELLSCVQNNCVENEHVNNVSAKFLKWFKNIL